MRLWMLLGGLIGFLIGLGLGVAQGNTWPAIFWRANVCALVGGVVLRWWGGVWMRSLLLSQRNPPSPTTSNTLTPGSRGGQR